MPVPRPALPALLVAAAIALAGCTSSSDKPHEPAAGQSPAATTGAVQPTETPTTAAPTTSPTPAAPTDGFLPTALVPGLNQGWHWQDGTSGLGDKPFGICAKADLASIGAVKVRQRTYFPPDDSDDNAAQQVAGFADPKSARQAWAVLDAWRGRCAATIGPKQFPKVGPEKAVPVAGDLQARWYLVSWAPQGDETGRFEAIGMVRDGALITVLRITNSAQDYDYPAGREPMVAMVQRAAQRISAGFGGSRQ